MITQTPKRTMPELPYQGWAKPTETVLKRERRLAKLALNYTLHPRDAAFRARFGKHNEETT